MSELLVYKKGCFFQFKIIINVLVSYFLRHLNTYVLTYKHGAHAESVDYSRFRQIWKLSATDQRRKWNHL